MNGLSYRASAALVWTAILAEAPAILAGRPYFSQLLAVPGGGAVWFVVLVPSMDSRRECQP